MILGFLPCIGLSTSIFNFLFFGDRIFGVFLSRMSIQFPILGDRILGIRNGFGDPSKIPPMVVRVTSTPFGQTGLLDPQWSYGSLRQLHEVRTRGHGYHEIGFVISTCTVLVVWGAISHFLELVISWMM
jgi:hypothetical protein